MSSKSSNFGILASAVYVPRWRISHETIVAAMGWSRGRSKSRPGGRSFCNWDEDSLTMAVEACRTLTQDDLPQAKSFYLASTSLPFADRSNSGLVREALNLPAKTRLADHTGSRRAATSLLLGSFNTSDSAMICASECVDTKPGSESETDTGHGAAALLLGAGRPIASLLASATAHQDFVDRYRMQDQRFDYALEARWLRDEGTRRQIRRLISEVLREAGLEAEQVNHFLMPGSRSVTSAVGRDNGLPASEDAASLAQHVGQCGSAHPLLLLHSCLAGASPGDNILLVGAGQGFDVILLRVEEEIEHRRPAALQLGGNDEENYSRYLGMRRLLEIDGGIRSERDNRSSQSAAFRRHADLHGFLGGRCSECGKLQFPRSELCVHCHAADSQEPESMADLLGEVNSFTEDWLAFSPRPPLIFGNVHFPGSANVMLEFTDFLAGELKAGDPVKMAFRIKDFDDRRGFRRYFWKPAPPQEAVTDA